MMKLPEDEYSKFDLTDAVENYQPNVNNTMNNGIFTLDWANIKSALIYGLISALLAMAMYTISVGDVFALDQRALINAGVFGGLNVLVSLIKNLLTTSSGNFLGVTKVIPETK